MNEEELKSKITEQEHIIKYLERQLQKKTSFRNVMKRQNRERAAKIKSLEAKLIASYEFIQMIGKGNMFYEYEKRRGLLDEEESK